LLNVKPSGGKLKIVILVEKTTQFKPNVHPLPLLKQRKPPAKEKKYIGLPRPYHLIPAQMETKW